MGCRPWRALELKSLFKVKESMGDNLQWLFKNHMDIISEAGFIFQLESLLSTQGAEKHMKVLGRSYLQLAVKGRAKTQPIIHLSLIRTVCLLSQNARHQSKNHQEPGLGAEELIHKIVFFDKQILSMYKYESYTYTVYTRICYYHCVKDTTKFSFSPHLV